MKGYVTREVKEEDWSAIEKMVRQSGALVASPSNIEDVYNAQKYRKDNLFFDIELKVILDNNIFTQILPLVDGRKAQNEPLKKEAQLICGIMCFLIYSGIETNPILALYERTENFDFCSKEKEDYFFRIADHLPPQVFADLALGKVNDVPQRDFEYAKEFVDSSHELQEEIKRANYNKPKSEEYLLTYVGVLQSFISYKEKNDELSRLTLYLKWSYEFSLVDPILLTFMIILLSDKRISKMIKKINTEDFDKIKSSILNATWDLKYLSLLLRLHQITSEDEIWFFCSRDKVLLDLAKYVFSLSNEADIHQFIADYYPKNKVEAIKIVDEYMKKTELRKNNLEAHRINIIDGLNNEIAKLEEKVKRCLVV